MLMENGDPIRKPQEVERWYDEGVRLIGPAWMASRYCGGTGEPGPLTDDGVRLLKLMQELNMILDTTHMAEQAFFQAIDKRSCLAQCRLWQDCSLQNQQPGV
jgi:membrane dipeptidase